MEQAEEELRAETKNAVLNGSVALRDRLNQRIQAATCTESSGVISNMMEEGLACVLKFEERNSTSRKLVRLKKKIVKQTKRVNDARYIAPVRVNPNGTFVADNHPLSKQEETRILKFRRESNKLSRLNDLYMQEENKPLDCKSNDCKVCGKIRSWLHI